jgi:hypothetical protein
MKLSVSLIAAPKVSWANFDPSLAPHIAPNRPSQDPSCIARHSIDHCPQYISVLGASPRPTPFPSFAANMVSRVSECSIGKFT